MKKLLTILTCLIVALNSFSQNVQSNNSFIFQPIAPTTATTFRIKGIFSSDSAVYLPIRENNWTPTKSGAIQFAPTQSALCYYNLDSAKWLLVGSGSGGGSPPSLATLTPGFGLIGVTYDPYSTNQTWLVDTSAVASITYINNFFADTGQIAYTVQNVGNDPPVSPIDSAYYLVGTAPTGIWTTHENQIARRIGTGYEYTTPPASTIISSIEEHYQLQYIGGVWIIRTIFLVQNGNAVGTGLYTGTQDNQSFHFITNDTTRFIIDSLGRKYYPEYAADTSTSYTVGAIIRNGYLDTVHARDLILTTNGSSGPAELIGNVLNIPQYSGGGGSETWQQTLINGSDLTRDNLINSKGHNFEMDSAGRFIVNSGDVSFNGVATQIFILPTSASLYSQVNSNVFATISANAQFAQLNSQGVNTATSISLDTNLISIQGALDSSTSTAPNLVGIGTDGNWHKYAPATTERFGIQDNLGLQDRSVDMGGFGLSVQNASNGIDLGATGTSPFNSNGTNSSIAAYSNLSYINSYDIITGDGTGVTSDFRGIGRWTNFIDTAFSFITSNSGLNTRDILVTPTRSVILYNDHIPRDIATSVNGNYADNTGNITISTGGTGTVTSVTSADANATVANTTTTPVITIVSAPKWLTGRTLSITGDLAYTSPSFDGSGNVTAAGTLATVNSNVGSFGDATHVGAFTVNGKGLVTAASSVAITGFASSTLTNTHLFVGNGSNVATDVAASGDLTLANTGAFTIANLAVTNAKIANSTIDLTAKVTGVLPIANGGTNNGSLSVTNGNLLYTDGSKVVGLGVGTAKQHLLGGTIPHWADTATGGGSSSAVFDSLTWIEAQDWGILPSNSEATNTTNATAAFTYLISRGGGTLYFKYADSAYKGVYVIPAVSAASNYVAIRLLGANPPSLPFGTVGTFTFKKAGCILQSSDTTNGDAVIRVLHPTSVFSAITLVVENIEIRTYDKPHISGIDALWANQLITMPGIHVNTGVYSVQASQPQSSYNTAGIITPGLGNGAVTTLYNPVMSGYYNGIDASEWTFVIDPKITACYRGIFGRALNHGAHIIRPGIQFCHYPVYLTSGQISIEDADIEHAGASDSLWQQTAYDLYDSLNLSGGKMTWQTTEAGTSTHDVFSKKGGIYVSTGNRGYVNIINNSSDYGLTIKNPSSNNIAATWYKNDADSAWVGKAGSTVSTFHNIAAGDFALKGFGSHNIVIQNEGTSNSTIFGFGGSEVARINTNGLGIGTAPVSGFSLSTNQAIQTSASGAALTLSAAQPYILMNASVIGIATGSSGMYATGDDVWLGRGTNSNIVNTTANSVLNIGVNNHSTPDIKVLANGNVGIGNTSPPSLLSVGSSYNTTNSIFRAGEFEIQPYSAGNLIIGGNVHYNGGYNYTVAASAAKIYMTQGEMQFAEAASGSAGAAISSFNSSYVQMKSYYDGSFGVGLQMSGTPGTFTNALFYVKGSTGQVGIGTTSPTAMLHLKAGTATANTAPLKFTSGTSLTTAEAGAMEFDGSNLYFTPTGTIRKVVPTNVAGRSTAQTAAVATVVTQTVGAADASYRVSANVLVTTSSAENFTVTVAYTDEGNTARTLTLNFQTIAGVLGTTVAFANGAVPYEGIVTHIRCKATTTITIATAAGGTYTGCTYNVEGSITQIN